VERDEARTAELVEVLKRYEGRRLFVAVLGSPDPDGLASAWALARIADTVGVSMDILTFEVLSRPDNAAFVQLLGIPFRRVVARLPRVPYAGFAVVDRQNARLPVAHKAGLPLVAHVDHHAPSRMRALFSHQSTTVGSTSTLMAHHFSNVLAGGKLDADEAGRVATALAYGIRTDTTDYLNANAADHEAAARLAPLVSTELMRAIALTPVGRPFLETLANALRSTVTEAGLAVAWAGRVGRNARDTIGQSADFLIRGEGTHVCVVFGLVNGSVVGSLRSSDPSLDPNRFLDEALSTSLGFPVDCGGRTYSGGFMIPVSSLPSAEGDAVRAVVADALLAAWKRRSRTRRRGR
jgi:nanoRNase/pAp phosphatase (c-di-AMP/oligoRNAs hydrolase)